MTSLFSILCLTYVAYSYVFFPLTVMIRGVLFKRQWQRSAIEPSVCFIIVCHNEAEHILAKLKNICDLDYPADKLSVVIASDGSDDGTDELVRQFVTNQSDVTRDHPNHGLAAVQLISCSRQGKIPALNRAMTHTQADLAVFSDANSCLSADVLRKLTRHFHDESIGCVAGNQVYLKDPRAGAASQGERAYWDFDRWLKIYESQAGNAISATGALYAIRRKLFKQVPSGVTDDFTISTRVILQGYRLIFDPEAIAYESIAGKPSSEYKRKVRVMTRGFRAIWEVRELLNPFRYGYYSIQLFSHKVLRRLVAIPLLILFALGPWMILNGGLLAIVGMGQYSFYGLAVLGWSLQGTAASRLPVFSIPFYFCLVNTAALHAVSNTLRGKKIELWNSHRAQTLETLPPAVEKN